MPSCAPDASCHHVLCDVIAACAKEQGPQLSEEEMQRRKEERARKREESRLAFLAACEKGPRVAIDCEWTPQLTDKVCTCVYTDLQVYR